MKISGKEYGSQNKRGTREGGKEERRNIVFGVRVQNYVKHFPEKCLFMPEKVSSINKKFKYIGHLLCTCDYSTLQDLTISLSIRQKEHTLVHQIKTSELKCKQVFASNTTLALKYYMILKKDRYFCMYIFQHINIFTCSVVCYFFPLLTFYFVLLLLSSTKTILINSP